MISNPILGLALTRVVAFIKGSSEARKRLHPYLLSIVENKDANRQPQRMWIGSFKNPIPDELVALIFHKNMEAANNNSAIKSFVERETKRIKLNFQISQ